MSKVKLRQEIQNNKSMNEFRRVLDECLVVLKNRACGPHQMNLGRGLLPAMVTRGCTFMHIKGRGGKGDDVSAPQLRLKQAAPFVLKGFSSPGHPHL